MESVEQRKARLASYVSKWRKNNPEKQKLARSRAYINRKIKAFKMLGGAICVNCGCDELSFLEINHINGGGAKEWRSRKGSVIDPVLSKKRSTEDLNVLCRVCNAIDFLKSKNIAAVSKYKIEWVQ